MPSHSPITPLSPHPLASSSSKDPQAPPSYNESAAPPLLNDPQKSRIAPVYDTMLEYLRNYDTVIIVDDSGSMAHFGRWEEARQALRAFADIAVQYDNDGIEIRFFNNPTVGQHIVSGKQVMELFDMISPNGGTPIGRVLESRISEYLRSWETQPPRKERRSIWGKFARLGNKKSHSGGGKSEAPSLPKPVNFLVITDGCPTDDPESVIFSLSRQMDQLELPPHQVGIQFVQIGDDAEATEYLQSLDDYESSNPALNNQPKPRDMVDTEPYRRGEKLTEAKLVKVLIGGINRRIDHKDNKRVQLK